MAFRLIYTVYKIIYLKIEEMMYCKTNKNQKMRHLNLFAPIMSNIIHDVINTPVNEMTKEQIKPYSVPAANILEHSDKFEIILAAPGFKKENMKIRVEKNTLIIEGEKLNESEIKFKHKEFNNEKIKRSFTLTDNVDLNKISAKFNEGLLHISVMKSEVTQPKNVEIL